MRALTGLGERLNSLTGFFKENTDIYTAYIFGSFGTERQTGLSDLDIALLFDRDITLLEELRYSAEICSVLMTDRVDVINLNRAPVYIQHEVLRSGTRIYELLPEKTMDFIEGVLEEYHNYEGILKKYRNDFEQGLQEEYLNG